MATTARIAASASSATPSRLKIVSSTALGKTDWVSVETFSSRWRLGRSDRRLALTSTAVRGLMGILRAVFVIPQKIAREEENAGAAALRGGRKGPPAGRGDSGNFSPLEEVAPLRQAVGRAAL